MIDVVLKQQALKQETADEGRFSIHSAQCAALIARHKF
jgi:hypothetical protein